MYVFLYLRIWNQAVQKYVQVVLWTSVATLYCFALLKVCKGIDEIWSGAKKREDFACSHIMGTGDTAEQVAAMDQQNTVLLWSCASAEFN